jgi:DNA-binding transcriptional LysR family regulator
VQFDQIETFLAVLTYGGFHKAAEALRVSQPAISARIKALEESLGVPLFSREGNSLTLSAAGKALRPQAEQLLRQVALARQVVNEQRTSAAGSLRIAAALSICTYFLPDVLKDYQAANPKVLVTLRSGTSMEVLKIVAADFLRSGVERLDADARFVPASGTSAECGDGSGNDRSGEENGGTQTWIQLSAADFGDGGISSAQTYGD